MFSNKDIEKVFKEVFNNSNIHDKNVLSGAQLEKLSQSISKLIELNIPKHSDHDVQIMQERIESLEHSLDMCKYVFDSIRVTVFKNPLNAQIQLMVTLPPNYRFSTIGSIEDNGRTAQLFVLMEDTI